MEQCVIIYSDLGDEDLNEKIFTGKNAKQKAEKFIESLDNKAILVIGKELSTEWHT